MTFTPDISNLCALLTFVSAIVYLIISNREIHLPDLIRCAMASMIMPDLILFLYFLIFEPIKAIQMHESTQYLCIAVLVISFLTIKEIGRIFKGEVDTG